MSMTKLSFCITTFNNEEYISSTLESIISQAGGDIEVIIGDSSSNNKTELIVKEFKKKFSNIIYKKLDDEGFGIDLSNSVIKFRSS